jgi:hypothetical protein
LKGIIKLCIGEVQEGTDILNKIAISMQEDDASGIELKNLKVDRFKQQVVEICDILVKEKDKFLSNRVRSIFDCYLNAIESSITT